MRGNLADALISSHQLWLWVDIFDQFPQSLNALTIPGGARLASVHIWARSDTAAAATTVHVHAALDCDKLGLDSSDLLSQELQVGPSCQGHHLKLLSILGHNLETLSPCRPQRVRRESAESYRLESLSCSMTYQ